MLWPAEHRWSPPGRFHRGRWTAAVLTRAGLGELVATSTEQFAEVVIRIGHDEHFRRSAAGRLREFGESWFDDPRPATELEAFWLEQASGR